MADETSNLTDDERLRRAKMLLTLAEEEREGLDHANAIKLYVESLDVLSNSKGEEALKLRVEICINWENARHERGELQLDYEEESDLSGFSPEKRFEIANNLFEGARKLEEKDSYGNAIILYRKCIEFLENNSEKGVKNLQLSSKKRLSIARVRDGRHYVLGDIGRSFDDKDPDFYYELAGVYAGRGSKDKNKRYSERSYELAIRNFKRAITIKPEEPKYYFHRGDVFLQTKQFRNAIEDYDKAIDLDAKKPEYYYQRGCAYFSLDEFNHAIKDFDAAIDLAPERPDYYYKRAQAYSSEGMYERAIEDFDRAIHLDSEEPDYYYNRGLTYYEKGESERAIDDFDKAIALDDSVPHHYYHRAYAYYMEGEYDHAIDDFNKAVELDETYVEAYRGHALALARRESQKSVATFEKEMKIQLEEQRDSFERQLKNLTDPEKVVEEYKEREKLIREDLSDIKKNLGFYTWVAQAILWVGFAVIVVLIGFSSYYKVEISTPTAFTAYLLLGGFFASCYALLSELRRKRMEYLHSIAESHDAFRKRIFARYPLFFMDDKEKRFEITHQFIEHMAEKSPAEFVLNWREKKSRWSKKKDENEDCDDAPLTKSEVRKIILQVLEETGKGSGT